MYETKKERQQIEEGGKRIGRVEGRKKENFPILFLNMLQGNRTNNRTIHDLNWKTYKDKNKTQAMSDHQHRRYS